ncbi:MAG TPA: DNA alkylation repair protein [Bacteroidales bacterium]|nr:DNA alkylation repair protein [Bacteroidales bacterium]
MNVIVGKLRDELIRNANPITKEAGERFFREKVNLYGLKAAQIKNISNAHYKAIADKSKENIFALCEELFRSGIMEESLVACTWSYNIRKQFNSSDFQLFEEWVNNYVNNWATCDTLCNHTVGTFIEMYPDYIESLKRWAHSRNRWMKRASAVSLIVPAKKGMFLNDIFEIADILHSDSDDMVQKGYGWMLKVASQAHQKDVFDYVMKKKATMPRTALRYAIEKMPPELRARAMAR